MLEEKVEETIKKFNMLSFDDKILVGVSGGPDSVVLLKILLSFRQKYNLSIYIAHLNHMLRGRESDEDADFVKNLAQKLDLPYEVKSCNLSEIIKKKRSNLEEIAREYRYKFFSETTEKLKINKIALGHNADDQVETFLMRLIRGSGLEGLIGIPPVRNKIIRPLIECNRKEIEEYCQIHQIEYRIDSSNKETIYFRNKIRLELLPLLSKEYNKNIKDIILHLQSMISEVSIYLQQKTELLFTEIVKVEGQERIIIDLTKFNTLALALKRRIIRKSIEVIKGNLYSINFSHNNEILKISEYQSGEKEVYLPDNLRAKKSYNQLIIYKKRISKNWVDEISIPWEYNILISGKTNIKALGIDFETKIIDSVEIKPSLYFKGKKPKGEFIEFIDYDKVKFPLKLRNRRIGDRFYPLKMLGEKKVKEYFMDNKIPKSHRDLIPILVDSENKIIWIVGMRMDDRVKISSTSKKILYIKMNIKTKNRLSSLWYDI